MTFIGWGGVEPPDLPDDADYELGTHQRAQSAITLTHIRVYGATTATSFANRKGRIWSTGGGLLASADLPDTLPEGWNLFPLNTPVNRNPGDEWIVSYSAVGGYGAIVHGIDTDVLSPTSDVITPSGSNGLLNFTPTLIPSVPSGNNAFFGIDVGFDLAGQTAPQISSIVTDVSNLSVAATAVVTDAETLGGATYAFDWGDGAESSGAGNTASHTYTAPGLYALLCVVTDSSGLSDAKAVPLSLSAPQAPGTLPPTSDLVASAWVGSVTGLPAGKVATTVPKDASTWADTGFVRAYTVGGSPDVDIAERAPVVQIECWAVNVGSNKPPWGKANHLAELIVAESYKRDPSIIVSPGAAYANALVQTVTVTSEPRRVPSDTGSYALIQFDVTLRWRDA